VPWDESQVSVGGLLALGYGIKRRSRKKRENVNFAEDSDCYWVEVSTISGKMK
jgi:hypothetical protein